MIFCVLFLKMTRLENCGKFLHVCTQFWDQNTNTHHYCDFPLGLCRNCGMLHQSIGQQVYVQQKPQEDSGLNGWAIWVDTSQMFCLIKLCWIYICPRSKALEIIKDFIPIPVSLSSSSVFLQARIPPPHPGSFYGNLGLVLLKILEKVLSFHPLMWSFPQVWRRCLSKFPHLRPLINNKRNKQHQILMISGQETKKTHISPPYFSSAAPSQHMAFFSQTELTEVCVCVWGGKFKA